VKQSVRFNIEHPDLCPALRWKGQFTGTDVDPTVPSTRDNQYWCVYTQTCLGPDNKLAEPYLCSNPSRRCHLDATRDYYGQQEPAGE
jgi:hypothetical protein